MTTNRPDFKAHDDFNFEHKKIGKVTREEFIKYIRSSHDHMRKLSQIIQQYDQTMDDYLNEWDGQFESFDEDVKDLLSLWIQDGTMDQIINENLMSSKADKTYVDDLHDSTTAQLAQNTSRLSEIFINAKEYGLVGDGVTDDTNMLELLFEDVEEGSHVYFPPGDYIFTRPLKLLREKHRELTISGSYNSKLFFNGCSGIVSEGSIGGLRLRHLQIIGDESVNTIGILLDDYTSRHLIHDVNVEGFGHWGLLQYGGLAYKISNSRFKLNGRNHTEEYGGSIKVTTRDDELTGAVSTTGVIDTVYCSSGGEYGLYHLRGVGNKVSNLIVEYHDKVMFGRSLSGFILEHVYSEANRGTDDDLIEFVDSDVTVISPRITQPIKYTWLNVPGASRRTTTIGDRDIETRYVKANQLLLDYNISRSVEEEGRVQYKNKHLEVHNGEKWKRYQTVDFGDTRPSGPYTGQTFFDTTLSKMIVWDGSWKNMDGTSI